MSENNTIPAAPFPIALVGAGGISAAHVDACKASEGRLQVVGVADPNPQARARVAAQTAATPFADEREMFDAIRQGVLRAEAVVVCTPSNTRMTTVLPALDLPVGVLCEKPLAHRLDEALTLAQKAGARKRIAAVGYCHRFTPAVVKLGELLEKGVLGELTRFENVFSTHFPAQKERWPSDPAVSGGGCFMDTGCHSLDLFAFLVGPPSVKSLITRSAWEGRGETSATALVEADGGPHAGVAGVIISSWLEPDRFKLRLIGTEASAVYDYLQPHQVSVTFVDGRAEKIDVYPHERRFLLQLLALSEAVRDGEKSQLATFDDGVVVARAIDEAYRLAGAGAHKSSAPR